ncbi:hypothetical protein [Lacipirellula limnantheis]|uniref:hypothetical protein n=1 Tax=Lacipirellula limnantheis TaxID=2528024 RepID=UPI001FE699C2|nr:hypothetical protein [Lacipirellula limnantheis]
MNRSSRLALFLKVSRVAVDAICGNIAGDSEVGKRCNLLNKGDGPTDVHRGSIRGTHLSFKVRKMFSNRTTGLLRDRFLTSVDYAIAP